MTQEQVSSGRAGKRPPTAAPGGTAGRRAQEAASVGGDGTSSADPRGQPRSRTAEHESFLYLELTSGCSPALKTDKFTDGKIHIHKKRNRGEMDHGLREKDSWTYPGSEKGGSESQLCIEEIVCVYTCVWMCMCADVYVCAWVRVCTCVHMYAHDVSLCVCMGESVHVWMCMCTCAYVCMCMVKSVYLCVLMMYIHV